MSEPAFQTETESTRQSEIAWEAKMIADARAELHAGPYATSAEVKAWINSIGTDRELPVPSRPLPNSAKS